MDKAETTGMRDLREDLEICVGQRPITLLEHFDFAKEAQERWPHAIHRALAAEELLSTHEPHGHNYTNAQYVNLREQLLAAEARVRELEEKIKRLDWRIEF